MTEVHFPSQGHKYPIYRRKSIFLAGTIDNGHSYDWQSDVINYIKSNENSLECLYTIYNPRRQHWNPNSSEQEIQKQIEWELYHIKLSDIIFFNFEPNSQSPITLLELGLCVGLNKKIIVRCPKTYYRYQNVATTLNVMTNIEVVESLDEALTKIC